MAKLNVILRDSGGNSKAGYRVAVYNDADELVYDTNLGTMIDNGDGSYISRTEANPGSYTVKYATTSSGTLAVVPGYEDFSFGAVFDGTASIANGGTGATTVEGAQQNLGLEPGVDVLIQDDRFDTMKSTADSLHGSGLDGICVSDKLNGNFAFVEPSVAREKLELEPGVDVQEWSAVLDAVAAIALPGGADYKFPVITVEGWQGATAATTRTALGLGSVATESTVTVAKGGTGATDAATARYNLGLTIGANVQQYNIHLDELSIVANETVDDFPKYVSLIQYAPGVSEVTAKTTDEVKSDLGLGEAALLDYTTTGQNGYIPLFNNGLHLPVLTSHPTPGSSNFGRIYCYTEGTSLTGSFGLYFIGRTSSEGSYAYERITLHERTWSAS